MKLPSGQNAPAAQLLPHTHSVHYTQARDQLLMWLSLSGKNIQNDNNDDDHHKLEVADFVYLTWHTGAFVCKSHLMSDPASVTVKVFSPGIFQKPLFTLPPMWNSDINLSVYKAFFVFSFNCLLCWAWKFIFCFFLVTDKEIKPCTVTQTGINMYLPKTSSDAVIVHVFVLKRGWPRLCCLLAQKSRKSKRTKRLLCIDLAATFHQAASFDFLWHCAPSSPQYCLGWEQN